ncbi:MAG: Sec-independent protein translocase protein TatB [Fretibacterium sp.]|nr:Sec-independent protein translocase protein TatB [Fretibacterium sp.]
MFNIGISELLVIFLIAFLIVGPEDLPKVARWLGRQIKKLRLLIREVKSELNWNELEKEIDDTQKTIDREIKHLDPQTDIAREVNSVSEEIEATTREIDQTLNK